MLDTDKPSGSAYGCDSNQVPNHLAASDNHDGPSTRCLVFFPHVDEVLRQHAQRIARRRSEDEQFLDFVLGLGLGLEGDGARAEAIGVEIEILGRGFAPHLVIQVAGLSGSADVHPSGHGFDDLQPVAAQIFVGSGVDAI